MAQSQNRVITTALAIVIIIGISVFAYTNFLSPDDTINDDTIDENTGESNNNQEESSNGRDDQSTDDEILLTIIHQGVNYTYTLSDLKDLPSFTGSGRNIRTRLLPDSVVLGTEYTYTGTPIESLLEDVNISSDKYKLNVTASDGWVTSFTMNESKGIVDLYDEDGMITENGVAIMIVAYKENGEYYSEIDPNNEIGPLRIAIVGDNTLITPSGLWVKMVETIEISYIS